MNNLGLILKLISLLLLSFSKKKNIYYLQFLTIVFQSFSHISHAQVVDTTLAEGYNELAKSFQENYQYDSSSHYFNLAGNIFKTHNEWEKYLFTIHCISVNKCRQYDFELGLTLLNEALQMGVTRFGEFNNEVGRIYLGMGHCYLKQEHYVTAIAKYKKALNILEKTPESNPLDIALIYSYLSNSYDELGDYFTAIDYNKQALLIYIRQIGDSNIYVAGLYNNLGASYSYLKSFDETYEYFNKALALYKTLLGNTHVNVGICYVNLGATFIKNKEYNKGIEYLNQAVSVLLKNFGEKHEFIAINYTNLSTAYSNKGDLIKSHEFLVKALNVILEIRGEKSNTLSQIYFDFGNLYVKQNKILEALPYYQKSIISLLIKNDIIDKNDIYSNPILNFKSKEEVVTSKILLLNTLVEKAECFYTLHNQKNKP